MKEEKDIFGEGYLARLNFANISQNPYGESDEEFEDHVKWSAGWLEAEIQISDIISIKGCRYVIIKNGEPVATNSPYIDNADSSWVSMPVETYLKSRQNMEDLGEMFLEALYKTKRPYLSHAGKDE